MIDDLGGLYSHASEAYRAGMQEGRDELFRIARQALSSISVAQEVSGPDEAATRGFHVAEQCCRALREARDQLEQPRKEVA